MKIKCPGCASLLEIPDSAAGKVVKCKCGKQLRAPAAQGAQGAPSKPAAGQAAAGQAAAGQGTRPPQPRRAAPAQSKPLAASMPPSGLFDELTDEDLTPVKAVHQPGAKTAIKAPGASAAKLLDEAISGSDRRGEALTMKGLAPRPVVLIIVGVLNILGSLFYFGTMLLLVGVVAMIPAVADEIPDADGNLLYLLAGGLGIMGLMCIATGIACFLRGKVPWYIILFSYGWGFADRVMEVVRQAVDEDTDINIIKAVVGILVGVGLWGFMHSEDVRAYFQTEGEPTWRIVTVDAVGFVLGAGLGAATVFML